MVLIENKGAEAESIFAVQVTRKGNPEKPIVNTDRDCLSPYCGVVSILQVFTSGLAAITGLVLFRELEHVVALLAENQFH